MYKCHIGSCTPRRTIMESKKKKKRLFPSPINKCNAQTSRCEKKKKKKIRAKELNVYHTGDPVSKHKRVKKVLEII